ncbi:MAG: imidazole glycerol phosphate synthase subunit HisH [Actinomycetota bacterium]
MANRCIGVIDYGIGNISSVTHAFAYEDIPVRTCTRAAELDGCSHVVLPGVGAFGESIARLQDSGLADAILAAIAAGRPLMGICLGMQLLLERSSEFGEHRGLGVLPGTVEPLAAVIPGLKAPNTGWAKVELSPHSRLAGTGPAEHFYFNHGFACRPDPALVTGRSVDGVPAVIERGNVFGVQFHPEKSHLAGLTLLGRFADLDGGGRP